MTDAVKRDPLNPQASALVDAQTAIKIVLKEAVLNRTPFKIINERIQRIIKRALAKVRSPTLKQDAFRSLNVFANKMYWELRRRLPDPEFTAAILLLIGNKGSYTQRANAERIVAQKADFRLKSYTTDAKGVPLQKYMKDYLRKDVLPVFQDMARARAEDPNASHASLRNLAEMQVRFEAHQKEINDFREAGQRLVVCSVHADCSDRCAPYQGRVYSLDGTRGRTEDGREFVPLEEATENPKDRYTTKSGKVYQNGLFGFNCRHKLFAYKPGMVIPSITKEEQRQEYKITKIQRELELKVLEARENALVASQDIDPLEYRYWKKEAKRRNQIYIQFSQEHGRAYYPDRTKIL